MNLPGSIFSRILDRLRDRRPLPEIRMRVTNLTRQTELANCIVLADCGETRRKGLLGREQLSANEGLWIVPCEAVHTFGMRFSIDLVYLDRRCRVRKVRREVAPWKLSGCLSAHSVLELVPGTILETQTQAGDTLKISTVSLTPSATESHL
jgi:hypothetical protein